MAVSNLKLQFERLSTAGGVIDNESRSESTPSATSSTPERLKKNRQEPKQDTKTSPAISKKQLKQIGKAIGSGSPSENRKSNTDTKKTSGISTKSKSVEESNDKLRPDASTVTALADVINKSSIASSPSSSTTSSPLTQSTETDETSPGGTPLRLRSSSAKERETKGRSAPLPMIVSKPSGASPTSSPKLKPKLAPKPASVYKPTENMTKPSIPPKPKILPKPVIAKKPSPVSSPSQPPVSKDSNQSERMSPVRQSSSSQDKVPLTDDSSTIQTHQDNNMAIPTIDLNDKNFTTSDEHVDDKGLSTSGEHKDSSTSGEHKGLSTSGEHKGLSTSGEHKGLSTSGEHKGLSTSEEHKGLSTSGEHKDLSTSGEHKGLSTSGEHKDLSTSWEQKHLNVDGEHIAVLPPILISVSDDDSDTLLHVQSTATSTNTDEVVGTNTKRGAIDSGYQEGMEEIREKWDTAKVCMYACTCAHICLFDRLGAFLAL